MGLWELRIGGFFLVKVMFVEISEERIEVNQAENGGKSIPGKSMKKCPLPEGSMMSRGDQN